MSSKFYNDVTMALQEMSEPAVKQEVVRMEEHTSNGEQTNVLVETVLELLVDEVRDLPSGCETNLILCTVTCGRYSVNTNMQLPDPEEPTCVKFNQVVTLNLQITRDSEGFYTPQAQYIVLDMYIRYNDKNKGDEFIGRAMLPVLYVTPSKHSYEVVGGATPELAVTKHSKLRCQVNLNSTPSDFVGWLGTQTAAFKDMQYKIILHGQIVPFPGTFETVEIYIPDVNAELCDENFAADVYFTNFRIVIIATKEESKKFSNWIAFSNIFHISKAYVQTRNKKNCCYSIKCYDCRTVKILVPALSTRQKIKRQIEETFSVVSKPQGNDKLVLEMRTPPNPTRTTRHATISDFLADTNICSSDGEANEAISEEDVLGNDLYQDKPVGDKIEPSNLYNTDIHTLTQVEFPYDEFSEDDIFDIPTVKVTDTSDGESVDSLDVLEEQSNIRRFTGSSVSSFTSYISEYTGGKLYKAEKSNKEVKHSSRPSKRWYHPRKVQMDSLRLRVRHHQYNTAVSYPYNFLLKVIPVERRIGFTRYNVDKEHNRQGDMRGWTKIDNTDYKRCKSYPPLFYVPVKASTSPILDSVFQFRSKGRIPALSWLNNSGAILMRSAQPRTGILQKHCREDEVFLEAARALSFNRNGKDLPLMIFDARSKIAASGNKMKGKGTENVANYDSTKLTFLDMANIHAIRDSFEKITAMCTGPSNSKWAVRLEQTQWLLHVQSLVRGAYFISQHLMVGGAALVHCSDGWDRTSQLTSLSLLLIDPYYRTYPGFQVLVEREWLSFGHRFHDRLGFAHPSQKSPIFLLFLDAVHQIITQFPTLFEFTPEYLIVLCDLFSSGWTTTFLRNCPNERSSTDRLQLWDALDAMRPDLTNDRYILSTHCIAPHVSLRHMVLWRKYFLRFDWWREMLAEDRQGPVVWVPDHAVQNCHLCHAKFNALKFKRRHHCRSCGNIFCGTCASRRICIPLKNYTTPVLVCDKCYQEHTASP